MNSEKSALIDYFFYTVFLTTLKTTSSMCYFFAHLYRCLLDIIYPMHVKLLILAVKETSLL